MLISHLNRSYTADEILAVINIDLSIKMPDIVNDPTSVVRNILQGRHCAVWTHTSRYLNNFYSSFLSTIKLN